MQPQQDNIQNVPKDRGTERGGLKCDVFLHPTYSTAIGVPSLRELNEIFEVKVMELDAICLPSHVRDREAK